MALITLLATLAPWLIGTAVVYALVYGLGRADTLKLSDHCMVIGSGAYVGYVALAAGMIALLTLGLNPFSAVAVAAWSLLTAASVAVIVQRFRLNPLTIRPRGTLIERAITAVGVGWLMTLAAWLGVEVWHNPVMSWDVVLNFGIDAQKQITAALGDEPRLTAGGTHPATVVMILVWSAFWADIGPTHVLGTGPWWVMYAGVVLMSAGLIRQWAQHWGLAVWLTAAIVSAPLIESHTAQGGYADLWVLGGLVAGLCWVLGGHDRTQRLSTMLVGLAVLVSVIGIKNTSVVYALIVMMGVGLGVLLTGRRAVLGYAALVAVAVAVGMVLIWGIEIDIGPLRAGFSPEDGELRLGNRSGGLAQVTPSEVVWNLWHAWVLASSFGVMFAAALIALPVATVYALITKDRVGTILAVSAWGLIGFLFAAQFSEYFLPAARVVSDTGLSRTSHAVYWITTMAVLATAISAAHRARNTHSAPPAA